MRVTGPELDRKDRTLARWLADIQGRFEAAGLAESRLKAEWLLSHQLGYSRLDLEFRANAQLTEPQIRSLDATSARMEQGEPLQYVLGETFFRDLRLRTDRRALIPRPETEQLVERALGVRELWDRARPRVADVGAGSGCIALAVARACPHAEVWATDVSEDALALARENGDRLFDGACPVHFEKKDLLEGWPPALLDAVISNPPYVSEPEWAGLDASIRRYEPRPALVGGPDGWEVTARLIEQAAPALAPGGWIFLEIGDRQGAGTRRRLEDAGFARVSIEPDLAGRDRFAVGRKS
jgi:release factor glutamine methyltransferase